MNLLLLLFIFYEGATEKNLQLTKRLYILIEFIFFSFLNFDSVKRRKDIVLHYMNNIFIPMMFMLHNPVRWKPGFLSIWIRDNHMYMLIFLFFKSIGLDGW